MTTEPGGAASSQREPREPRGVIGLRVPGAIGYRHLAIRLVTTACKMALDASGPGAEAQAAGEASDEGKAAPGDFEAEVVSAFGEAFNNVAVHGFRDIPPGPVQIEVDWDDEKLTITIVEEGHSFDPNAVAAPDLDALPEGGMGLFIMRSCMDQLDYRPGPPNVLRMVKLRSRTRLGIVPPPPESGARTDDSGLDHAGSEPSRGVPTVDHVPEEPGRGSGVDLVPDRRPDRVDRVDRVVESSRRR